MTDPKRLLSGDGTPFERSLLGAVADEAPPAELRLRMEHALGISKVAAPVVQAKAAGALVGKLSAGALAIAGVVAGGIWLATSGTSDVDGAAATGAIVDTAATEQVERAPRDANPANPANDETASAKAEVANAQHHEDENSEVVTEARSNVAPVTRSPSVQQHAETKPARATTKTPAEVSTLREEIALLDRARQAVKAGKRKRALALLADYARRFPKGNLEQEASVLRVEALEQDGELSRASAVAQEFLEQHPESPHAERVERSSRPSD